MRIALAQIAPYLGEVQKNLEIHLRWIEKAVLEKADLIVFPELSLTGYTLMDLVPEVALAPAQSPSFKKLKAASRAIDIAFGFMEEKERGIFYNSAAYLSGGRVLHVHRKVFLPTGGMFEEAKFFARGRNFGAFPTRFAPAGLLICRDFLSYAASYLLFVGGAEIVIVLSAAPGRGHSKKEAFMTSRMWELMGEAISYFSTCFVIYCNRVGFEDGKVFAGGSFIFNPAGRLLFKASEVDEDLAFLELDLGEIRLARQKWTFKRDEQPEIILQALKRIIHENED